MRRKIFDSYEELSDYMVDMAQNGLYTVAVLFYEDAIKLLRELMLYTEVDVESLEIMPPEHEGYEKEYYISIADDMIVSVEPAYVGDKYLDAEADLTLIDGEASSTILKHIPDNKCREIYIFEDLDDRDKDDSYDYDEDCCNDCDECVSLDGEFLDDIFEEAELVKDDKGNVTGIKVDIQSIFDYLFN